MNEVLGRQMRELAEETGTTFTSLVEEAFTLLLRERRNGATINTKSLPPLPTRNLGGAVEGVDLSKTSEILADLDAERYGLV